MATITCKNNKCNSQVRIKNKDYKRIDQKWIKRGNKYGYVCSDCTDHFSESKTNPATFPDQWFIDKMVDPNWNW